MWDKIAMSAWSCADPGLQFDTTINEWHTCPADGRINASNPCSEYMFLDDTACNLASLNLMQVHGRDEPERRRLRRRAVRHACRLWTIVLEISVLMAQFPSEEIARLSYKFRTLGLGYANLGTYFMLRGIPYDSDEAVAICGGITAIMTAASYAASAELARELGPFPGYAPNRETMLRVMRNHRRAAYDVARGEYEGLSTTPRASTRASARPTCSPPRASEWDSALRPRRAARLPQRPGHGHRPDRHHRPADGLRHHRHRARLRPREVQEARRRRLLQDHQPVGARGPGQLGYGDTPDRGHRPLLQGRRHPGRQPADLPRRPQAQGLHRRGLERVESELAGAFEIGFVFNRYVLGDDFCRDAPRLHRRAARRTRCSTSSRPSASPPARHPRPTTTSAAP
jgi:ribonucleoside-diphosphate reductase alpha chain